MDDACANGRTKIMQMLMVLGDRTPDCGSLCFLFVCFDFKLLAQSVMLCKPSIDPIGMRWQNLHNRKPKCCLSDLMNQWQTPFERKKQKKNVFRFFSVRSPLQQIFNFSCSSFFDLWRSAAPLAAYCGAHKCCCCFDLCIYMQRNNRV